MHSQDGVNGGERAYDGPERRTRDSQPDDIEPVVLTRKYAHVIDGIDLVGKQVGDRLPLRVREAGLLIAEDWAEPAPFENRRRKSPQ